MGGQVGGEWVGVSVITKLCSLVWCGPPNRDPTPIVHGRCVEARVRGSVAAGHVGVRLTEEEMGRSSHVWLCAVWGLVRFVG